MSPISEMLVDFVAPVDSAPRWNTPLGPIYIDDEHAHMGIRDDDQPHAATIRSLAITTRAAVANPDFGKTARVTSAELPQATILRGMPQSQSGSIAIGFEAILARSGVGLAAAVDGQLWYRKPETEFLDNATRGPGYDRATQRLVADVASAGKGLEWSIYKPQMEGGSLRDAWCEAFPHSIGVDEKDELSHKTAQEIDLAYRFNRTNRIIWVSRATCFGGATASSAHVTSTLNIFDSRANPIWHGHFRVLETGAAGATLGETILDRDFRVKLFDDRLIVTYAPASGAIMVYDLDRREFLMQLEYARRGDLLEDVFVDAEGQHLFQLNTDGSFTVYRLRDEAAVLEGRYLDDELVVWTADFHFDATEEGAAFVELRFPGLAGQYSFQQFDGALRVPGLLRTVLSGRDPPRATTVSVPPRMTGNLTVKAGRITGLAQARGTQAIKAVRLFQDGVLTTSFEASPEQLITVDAPRQKGARWATLVAEDVGGLVSLPLNVDLGPDPAGLPRTHFLGVGVDYYADARLEPLNYGKLDAVKMSKTFTELNGRSVALVTNSLLTDRRASLENLPKTIDRLLEVAEPGDHVVMFFAGHGLKDDEDNFYFGLSGTDLDDLPGTALNWQDLSRRFAGQGLRITVLLDACHAGAAGTSAFATNDAAVAGLTESLVSSMTVLSAAKGRQFSGESASVGGGYFTDAIRDVLLQSRATFDENRNGVLEVVEFYRGVKTKVVARRGAKQTPWLSRNQLVGEYGLF